jgi:hypothetical protein
LLKTAWQFPAKSPDAPLGVSGCHNPNLSIPQSKRCAGDPACFQYRRCGIIIAASEPAVIDRVRASRLRIVGHASDEIDFARIAQNAALLATTVANLYKRLSNLAPLRPELCIPF